jgi:hypothetical protein
MQHCYIPSKHARTLSCDGGMRVLNSSTVAVCIDDVRVYECYHQWFVYGLVLMDSMPGMPAFNCV